MAIGVAALLLGCGARSELGVGEPAGDASTPPKPGCAERASLGVRPATELIEDNGVSAIQLVFAGSEWVVLVRANVEGSVVRFDSVDVLAPDAKLNYRIKVKALQAGTGRLLVSVTSDNAAGGKIRLEEVSTVVEP